MPDLHPAVLHRSHYSAVQRKVVELAVDVELSHPYRLAGCDPGGMVGDVDVTPFTVPHGRFAVTGYRIGPLAYVTDAKSVPEDVYQYLRGAKVLVLNALFRTEHPTHLSIPEAIRVAQRVGAERTYFTHLTHENFHADLEAELPRGIAPAFDGLTVRID
jgi:phosphoribosyl 1,2-cyclic phosphate phosphodiesterase